VGRALIRLGRKESGMEICYHSDYGKVRVEGTLINCIDCNGVKCTERIKNALSSAGITAIIGLHASTSRLCTTWQSVLIDANRMATEGNQELIETLKELSEKQQAEIRSEMRSREKLLGLLCITAFITTFMLVNLLIGAISGKINNLWYVMLLLFFIFLAATLYVFRILSKQLKKSV
jgi:cation transport ATPase